MKYDINLCISICNYKINVKKGDSSDDSKFQNETNSKVMWDTFKKLTNSSKQVPPRVISHEGSMVTSLKKIVNIANVFFLEKNRKIREAFPENYRTNALEILEHLIPKNNKRFEIKMATMEDISRIIKKSKPKNSTGNDIINMKLIKN